MMPSHMPCPSSMSSSTARTNHASTTPAPHMPQAPATARAREALAGCPGSTDECDRVLELLRELGGDEETQAASIWFYPARDQSPAWQQAVPSLPPGVTRLVDGQLAAERVWRLHAARGDASEGLRRLLL